MIDYLALLNEIEGLYQADKRPWIIGFSGGKDSTCVVQLVYSMLKSLPTNERRKEVSIVCSDTLVESPAIQERIKTTLDRIQKQAFQDHLPINVDILRPKLGDTFWVNLIGRGYPSPNRWFRWCTDRLKIKPMTEYTLNNIDQSGEVLVVLGARKDESASRSQTLKKHHIEGTKLKSHSNIPRAFIYTPIEDWSFQDVWTYLLQAKSPWGDNNRDLVTLYQKCDSECPLVIDESTPACGGSRFGCWTCTVVERDRALEGLIEEGDDWLKPLLDFRNWLKEIRDDPEARETMRKTEKRKKIVADYFDKDFEAQERRGHRILGPFRFSTRHEILRKLVELQEIFSKRGISLISAEEIKAIEILWIYEGDNISSITDILGDGRKSSRVSLVTEKDKLEEICTKYGIAKNLVERLVMVEGDLSRLSRRRGVHSRIEKVLEEHMIEEQSQQVGRE